MPRYVFHCESCGRSENLITLSTVREFDCKCGHKLFRKLPTIAVHRVTEIMDKYTNTTRDQDHESLTKTRRDDHYWLVEVPRLIETCSLETSLENGWLVYNERQELVINKPPGKR
jgi:DNA-directed RNA polymerase subunit RPC12/RpoP